MPAAQTQAAAAEAPASDAVKGPARRWVFRLRSLPLPPGLLAFAFYLAISAVVFGRGTIAHPRSVCLCAANSTDPEAYMWALRWWPWAIAHGTNPFVSHIVYAPGSYDTAAAALIPTAGIVLAPFTLWLGPIFSYNLLSIFAPALAGYTAYRLARRLTGATLPSLAAGYLYGFSSALLAQLGVHLSIVLAFLFPLMAEAAIVRARGGLRRRWYIAGLALLMILQLGISTEMLLDAVALGALVLVAALVLAAPEMRRRVRMLIAETAAAGLLAAVIASPFLYYALTGPLTTQPDWLGLDALNPVVPSALTRLGRYYFGGVAAHFEQGNLDEVDGYFGVVLLVAFAVFTVTTWRRIATRLLFVAFAGSLVYALGAHLHIMGVATIPLPMDAVAGLPWFAAIAPSRAAMFAALALAVAMAMWLAPPARHSWMRWSTVLVGTVLLFPNAAQPHWFKRPINPAFFTTDAYRHYITKGANVLVLPFFGYDDTALWQAETGMYFKLPDAYLGYVPRSATNGKDATLNAAYEELLGHKAPVAADIAHYVHAKRIRQVVLDPSVENNLGRLRDTQRMLRELGLRPRRVGGVDVYQVPRAPPPRRRKPTPSIPLS